MFLSKVGKLNEHSPKFYAGILTNISLAAALLGRLRDSTSHVPRGRYYSDLTPEERGEKEVAYAIFGFIACIIAFCLYLYAQFKEAFGDVARLLRARSKPYIKICNFSYCTL